MTGKAGVFSPAYSPIFNPAGTRGATRVRLQAPGYGGGSDFPFQWSWPGLINYTAAAPGIPTITGRALATAYYTLITGGGPVQVGIYVNGVFQTSVSFSGSGSAPISVSASIGSIVGVAILSVGSGAAEGLWFGLTES